MGRAMKLPILTKTAEANVAVELIKRGRPWMGFSLMVISRVIGLLIAIAFATLGAIYGLR